MPHSPYTDTVYPPIDDLDEYRRELRQSRSRYEEGLGEKDTYSVDALLDDGDNLLEHCDFLDTKLNIKVRIHLIAATVKLRFHVHFSSQYVVRYCY